MSLHQGVKIDVRKVRSHVVRDDLECLHVTQADNDPPALIFWWDGYMLPEEFFTIYAH
jgi:hypothetical protein